MRELFKTGRNRRVRSDLQKRALLVLDALNVATSPEDLNLPGFSFHRLIGNRPPRFSIHINGPWCITFEIGDGDIYRVDLEQYH
jgi:proteic killer suppression protein